MVYLLHGLRVRSPVPLAGDPQAGGGHDLDVRWALGPPVGPDVPPGRPLAVATRPDGTSLYVAVEQGGRRILRVSGFCDFVIDEGPEVVECRLDPSADPRFVAVLVAGLLVAFVLGLDGRCVLHASAVELDGVALAIAGPSGSGKSTLAALLCAAGARLVTDDVCRLDLEEAVSVVGGSPQLRLRPGAMWTLDHFPVAPAQTATVDGRMALAPGFSAAASLPLAAVVLPAVSGQAAEIVMRPLRGAVAVFRLAGALRVSGWSDPSLVRAHFEALARVAAGVRVIEAQIPWAPARPKDLVAALRALA